VAGGFLVAAAATLVLTAWLAATARRTERWVVARHDLAAGAQLQAGDLTTESLTLPNGPTAANAFRATAALDGRVLAAPVLGGELVQSSALVPLGSQPSLRPVTVSLQGPAFDLTPGHPADVLVTEGDGSGAATSVVVRGAEVLGLTGPGSSLVASSSGDDVTLGVADLAEVEAIVHAARTGSVTVVVAEPSDGTGLGPPPGHHFSSTRRPGAGLPDALR
jgi:Flp pilus assembly protein CpaB